MTDELPPERTKIITWDDPRHARREARRMSGAEFFDAMRRGKIRSRRSESCSGSIYSTPAKGTS